MKKHYLFLLFLLPFFFAACSHSSADKDKIQPERIPKIELVNDVSEIAVGKITCGMADSVLIFKVTNNFYQPIILYRSDYYCGNSYDPGNIIYFKKDSTSSLVFDAISIIEGAGLEVLDTLISSQSNYYYMLQKYLEDDFKRSPFLILRFPFVYIGGKKEETLEIFLQIDEKNNQVKMADTSLIPSDYRTERMVWGS